MKKKLYFVFSREKRDELYLIILLNGKLIKRWCKEKRESKLLLLLHLTADMRSGVWMGSPPARSQNILKLQPRGKVFLTGKQFLASYVMFLFILHVNII